MTNTAHVLLVETDEGGIVAVRFPSVDAARQWEDEHEDRLTVVGCFPVTTKAEALR
jgi:hypothetical protein